MWHQLKDQSYIRHYMVQRLLTQSAIPLDSDLGRFVGSVAYEAAAVAPVCGDQVIEGWLTVLDPVLYPPQSTQTISSLAPGCYCGQES